MDAGTMKRFVEYLMRQQEELMLEIKAIRRLLEEKEAANKDLAERLAETMAELGEIRKELVKANKELRSERRKAIKYRELWEREKQNPNGDA